MKKISTLISGCLLFALTGSLHAQWCTPTTAIPYASTMPGITQFTLGTINRSSADLETGTGNSYVNTQLTTNLTPGMTYTVTIGYTIDASICPDMNLRVWIDYNQDGALDDPGEDVISVNNQTSLTYTGSFTVPLSVTAGATKCRVTAKMTSNGGHTLPTPCDVPNDPLGYHGEFEDYNINMLPVGVTELPAHPITLFSVYPNPSTDGNITVQYDLNIAGAVSISIYDALGKQVARPMASTLQPEGSYVFRYDNLELQDGIYFVTIESGNGTATRKCVISRE